jgi:hypothetical protein
MVRTVAAANLPLEGSFVNFAGKTVRWKRNPKDPSNLTITIDDEAIDWMEEVKKAKGK